MDAVLWFLLVVGAVGALAGWAFAVTVFQYIEGKDHER